MSTNTTIPFPQRATNNRPVSRERLIPQNLEAEQSTIGAMLMKRDAVVRALQILTPDDFYRELHKKIYKAVLKLFDKGEPIDIVTVAEELRRNGQLDDVGGLEYLSTLVATCPANANIETYTTIVREKSMLRQLVKASDEIAGWAYSDGVDEVNELVDRSKKRILDISSLGANAGFSSIQSLLVATYDQIDRQFQHRGEISGISTGFIDFDDITSGLQRGELTILASRPLMGKTTMALNIAHHIALKERKPVAYFSLKFSKEQIVQRLICCESSVKSQDLISGCLQDIEWHRVTNAVNNLYQTPIFIHDSANQKIDEINQKINGFTVEHGQLGLIVVDSLQLTNAFGKSENRVQGMSEITRILKNMARKFNCPILALSQLSSALEQRNDKRPQLKDLQESGSIEAEADVVAFIYRPSYYKRKLLHKGGAPDPNAEPDPDEGLAEVIIGKQRNGPVGTIRLGFQPEYARFTNLARSDYGGDY